MLGELWATGVRIRKKVDQGNDSSTDFKGREVIFV